MGGQRTRVFLLPLFAAGLLLIAVVTVFANLKKWAVVAPAGSKLEDVALADMVQFCKGAHKSWPDGRSFTLVMHSPESPEMRNAVQVLFGVSPAEMKSLLANVNQSRTVIKVVDSDEELLRTVLTTPGAVGIMDVYAINSSVKVVRIDGKLPFDTGYALKSN